MHQISLYLGPMQQLHARPRESLQHLPMLLRRNRGQALYSF
jgi:hypothetical protein